MRKSAIKNHQFLRHLRNLADNTVNDDFLRIIWVSRLATYLQLRIAVQTDGSLDQQASMADAIVDITSNQKSQVIEIS